QWPRSHPARSPVPPDASPSLPRSLRSRRAPRSVRRRGARCAPRSTTPAQRARGPRPTAAAPGNERTMNPHLRKRLLASFLFPLALAAPAHGGPFLDPSILTPSAAIVAWASGIAAFQPATSGSSSGANALGPANGDFASLGDLGAAEIAA